MPSLSLWPPRHSTQRRASSASSSPSPIPSPWRGRRTSCCRWPNSSASTRVSLARKNYTTEIRLKIVARTRQIESLRHKAEHFPLPIQPPVHFRVAQHRLHVVPRFREGDRFHKLRGLPVGAPPHPFHHLVRTRIVRGERLLHFATLLIQHRTQNRAADFQIRRRLVQHARGHFRYPRLARKLPSRGRTNLREAVRLGPRHRLRIELRLLADQPRQQVGIQIPLLRGTQQIRAVRQREEVFPKLARRGRHRQVQILRSGALHDPHRLVRSLGRGRQFHPEQRRLPVRAHSKA